MEKTEKKEEDAPANGTDGAEHTDTATEEIEKEEQDKGKEK